MLMYPLLRSPPSEQESPGDQQEGRFRVSKDLSTQSASPMDASLTIDVKLDLFLPPSFCFKHALEIDLLHYH